MIFSLLAGRFWNLFFFSLRIFVVFFKLIPPPSEYFGARVIRLVIRSIVLLISVCSERCHPLIIMNRFDIRTLSPIKYLLRVYNWCLGLQSPSIVGVSCWREWDSWSWIEIDACSFCLYLSISPVKWNFVSSLFVEISVGALAHLRIHLSQDFLNKITFLSSGWVSRSKIRFGSVTTGCVSGGAKKVILVLSINFRCNINSIGMILSNTGERRILYRKSQRVFSASMNLLLCYGHCRNSRQVFTWWLNIPFLFTQKSLEMFWHISKGCLICTISGYHYNQLYYYIMW
jgi:hypothetical protein